MILYTLPLIQLQYLNGQWDFTRYFVAVSPDASTRICFICLISMCHHSMLIICYLISLPGWDLWLIQIIAFGHHDSVSYVSCFLCFLLFGFLKLIVPWTKWPPFHDSFKYIFMNEKFCIAIKISQKFVPKCPIKNKSALVQVMACRRIGDKPLPEPMLTQFTFVYMQH